MILVFTEVEDGEVVFEGFEQGFGNRGVQVDNRFFERFDRSELGIETELVHTNTIFIRDQAENRGAIHESSLRDGSQEFCI